MSTTHITDTSLGASLFYNGDGDIADIIFDFVSTISLFNLQRVSRRFRDAIDRFKTRNHVYRNPNLLISRFFSNPLGFRSLQARTATLISGSSALQFFDRVLYPESDLDLYVHPNCGEEVGRWLIDHEGYRFRACSSQSHDFATAAQVRLMEHEIPLIPDLEEDSFHIHTYGIVGVNTILTFVKSAANDSESMRKVQIMVSTRSPLECILGFHSTCVMNIIAWDAAYSLYPYATFSQGCGIITNTHDKHLPALEKYRQRGYNIISTVPTEEAHGTPFYCGVTRWIGDDKCWIIPLDCAGLELPKPLASDPVGSSGWVLRKLSHSMKMMFHTVNSTLFKFKYPVGDLNIYLSICAFARNQGRLQHQAIPVGRQWSDPDIQDRWIYWDAMFREIRDALLMHNVE